MLFLWYYLSGDFMEKKIRSFIYKEFGSTAKTRGYTFERKENTFVLKISGDRVIHEINVDQIDSLFSKYDFDEFTTLDSYPFKLKDQIDYQIKIEYLEGGMIKEINGYSHYPEFYNDFILDLHKVAPFKSVHSLRVKEEMLDKDKKYITNYVEKMSIYNKDNTLMITLDKLNDSEYEVDIDVPDLKSFFKKDDFDFSLPINCHYFTYIVNKICGFAKNGTSRKGNYDDYIDIRLANKKHKYFEIDEECIKMMKSLFYYLNLFYKLPLLNAFVDEEFSKNYIESHKKPNNKEEVRKNFEYLVYQENYSILKALKEVAKNNQNFSMYELVSIAYKSQKDYFIYIFDIKNMEKGLKEVRIPSEKEKNIVKYFKYEYLSDLSIYDLSKDYDVYYYENDGLIHLIVVSSRFPELEYLKLDEDLKINLVEVIKNHYGNN